MLARRLARLVAIVVLALPAAAFADFCSGKASGYWCDGDKLTLCQSGSVASASTCPNGCQSMPTGTDDTCKDAAPTGFCSGKQNGAWCDGNNLVQCSGGNVQSSQTCPDGCQSNAAGVPDTCVVKPAPGGGTPATDTLQLCNPFAPPKSVTCAFACYDGHKGSDYAAPEGAAIYAPTSGDVVAVVNTFPGQTCTPSFGNYVKIASGPFEVILGHMRKDIQVGKGPIKAGTLVGYVSNSGHTLALIGGVWTCNKGGGHHLHPQTRKNGVAFNATSAANVQWVECDKVGFGGGGEVVATGFCAGKQDGMWCQGQVLLQCAGGATLSPQPCVLGCQSNPAGVADDCKPVPDDVCVGLPGSTICAGATLRTCTGGKSGNLQLCAFGCGDLGAGLPCTNGCDAAATPQPTCGTSLEAPPQPDVVDDPDASDDAAGGDDNGGSDGATSDDGPNGAGASGDGDAGAQTGGTAGGDGLVGDVPLGGGVSGGAVTPARSSGCQASGQGGDGASSGVAAGLLALMALLLVGWRRRRGDHLA